MKTSPWQHSLRMISVLALLGVAVFPIYWMLVTSLTTSSELLPQPRSSCRRFRN